MRPPDERGNLPFATASPQNLHSNDKVNLSPVHALIFAALREKHGEAHARAWLETEGRKGRINTLPELHRASDLPQPSVATEKVWSLSHQGEGSKPLRDTLRSPNSRLEGKSGHFSTPKLPPSPVKRLSEIDPAQEAEERMSRLEAKLHPSVRLLYRVLLELALVIAKRRGYAQGVSRVTFFCPQELLAFALGVDRTTVWRNLKPLKALGLVAAEDFVTTVQNSPSSKSNNITAGKLWNIKLEPSDPNPARLALEDYQANWRDLERDIEQGKTVHNFIQESEREVTMQQSYTEENTKRIIELLLDWALPPSLLQTPLSLQIMTVAPELETILDLPGTPKPERNEMVNVAAKSITYALGDTHSYLPFYRRLLWNLLRRYDQGQDYFMPFYEMILRARADHHEGFARKAGALLHSRLKAWPVWDELQRTPPVRVGVSPIRA